MEINIGRSEITFVEWKSESRVLSARARFLIEEGKCLLNFVRLPGEYL